MSQNTVKKVTKLTDDDVKELDAVKDKWIALGLSTSPANRAEAEQGVVMAYEAAGLQPPRFILWADSPMAGVYYQAVAPFVIPSVLNQVAAAVTSGGNQIASDDPVKQLTAEASKQIEGRINTWTSGLMYDYMLVTYSSWTESLRHIGVTNIDIYRGVEQIGKNAYWAFIYDYFAVLVERPNRLERDQLGRLHNPTGAAMSWADGFSIYCWHGVRVPSDLIETGWDYNRILQEKNTEIRRCAIERLGWDEFIKSAGLKPVGESLPDPGNQDQTLTLYDIPRQIFGTDIRILMCTNGSVERDGTRRRYGLTVPATMKDPISAAAWTYDLTREQYLSAQIRR